MEKTEFSGVQDTLFLPLGARVAISETFPEYFYDETAMKFKDMPEVKAANAKGSEYSSLASVARYYNMDRIAKNFIEKYPDGNIAILGAGLETMNNRLNRKDINFFIVDFQDVITLREKILGKLENETLIGCDITDLAWTKDIDKEKPILFIVSGVFQYFQPEAVSRLIADLKKVFKNAEMVFDATNEVGIKYAQRYVKKTGNLSAMMYFFVNDPKVFANENKVELLEVRKFYDEARKIIGKKAGLYSRVAMKVADDKNRTLIIHIKLN